MKTNKCLTVAVVAIILTLVGCGKGSLYQKTTPYEIDSADKVSISFESKKFLGAIYGAFFVSAEGIPSPGSGATYNPIEILANTKKTIKVRAYSEDSQKLNATDLFYIDKEIDLELPALKTGSYTISYSVETAGKNKRLELKDSSGNIIIEKKVE